MKNLNLSTEQVEAINHDHIYTIDKLYRMHAGISSRLIFVQNGVALLEIDIHSGWKKPHEVTAKQFIESWSNHTPKLKDMDAWEVRVFTSEKIAGFAIHPDNIETSLLQQKLDQMNANPERFLVYVYKAYKATIKHPMITLKDSENKFNLEYLAQVEVIKCGFFDIRESGNYIIENSNTSRNLFLVPHTTDDYLIIIGSEYGNHREMKHLKASKTPVTFSFHSKVIYLVNLAQEDSGILFWKSLLNQEFRDGIVLLK